MSENEITQIINQIINISLKKNQSEIEKFILSLQDAADMYIKFGARSSKKVNVIHNNIKHELKKILPKNYKVKLEYNVSSMNSSGKKKCDIVILDSNKDVIYIFPVKFVMTNYNQNKNNYYENLTGEIIHLHMMNNKIKIIPINIIFNLVPYLDKDKKITKFEIINYDKTYKIYEKLVEFNYCFDVINYIIDVKHNNKINEKYNLCPTIIGFNKKTNYRNFKTIIKI